MAVNDLASKYKQLKDWMQDFLDGQNCSSETKKLQLKRLTQSSADLEGSGHAGPALAKGPAPQIIQRCVVMLSNW